MSAKHALNTTSKLISSTRLQICIEATVLSRDGADRDLRITFYNDAIHIHSNGNSVSPINRQSLCDPNRTIS